MGKLIFSTVLIGLFNLWIHALAVYLIWNFLLASLTGITITIGHAVGALGIIYPVISYGVFCYENAARLTYSLKNKDKNE